MKYLAAIALCGLALVLTLISLSSTKLRNRPPTRSASPELPTGSRANPSNHSKPTAPTSAAMAQPAPASSIPWTAALFANPAKQEASVEFALPDSAAAQGTVEHTEYRNGELIYISGKLSVPEPGRFFFQKQTLPGNAGDYVGVVEFPGSQRAFRVEPTGVGGAAELRAHPLKEVVCLNMPLPIEATSNQVEEIPPLKPSDFPTVPIPDYQKGIVVLESLPGSTPVIYLDFQGGYTPTWGGITYQRPSVNNAQIKDVWVRVAEDYMPFNINVTTDLGVYQRAPEGRRQRVVITPTNKASPGAGGVAYIGSFQWTGDTPCWVFMTSGKSCAEACSHEAGHTLGLGHDGTTTGTEYYAGQGSGDTGWAPIMGVGYGQPVTQWSKGEYPDANNTQDDLTIISMNNDVAYRADDTGDSLATARYLEVYTNYTVKAQGVIESTDDVDAFQFSTTGGLASFRVDPVVAGPNVALRLFLCDSNENIWRSSNPQNSLWASFSTNLPAGTYTVKVAGMGRNSLSTGFSSYASLGFYAVSGSVANGRLPDRFTTFENALAGTTLGKIALNNPNQHPLEIHFTSGNELGVFAIDSTGQVSIADPTQLDYEELARRNQFPVQFELFADITDTSDGSATELNRRIVIAVENVNEPPSVQGFTASVPAHTRAGTVLGAVMGSDPDFYTLLRYSISGGDESGMFAIDRNTGELSVAGDPDHDAKSDYELTISVSDQTGTAPLSATCQVHITVLPNSTGYQPGTIGYAQYTNIPGNLISTFTTSPSFPLDPAFEKQLPTFEAESDQGDNFGAVMRGYLLPPVTGNYTFWIASDDNGELWLSSGTNSAGMKRVAWLSGDGAWAGVRDWEKYPSQESTPIQLTAGNAYYIEARMKEGGGNDHLAVAWASSDAAIEREVIPGRYLAPASLNYKPKVLPLTVNVYRNAVVGTRVATVRVTDANASDTTALSLLSGDLGGVFDFEPQSGTFRVKDEAALLSTSRTRFGFSVQAVDNGMPPRSSSTTIYLNVVGPETILAASPQQELWYNIGSATGVNSLTNNAKFPRRPDALRPLDSLDSGGDIADNYGSRIRGYLKPPQSGQYTFYISSDDSSLMRFSMSTNPASATVIASLDGASDRSQWDKAAS